MGQETEAKAVRSISSVLTFTAATEVAFLIVCPFH